MISHARIAGLALGVALFAFFLVAPAIPLAIAPPERVANGQFEEGFDGRGVGLGWAPFDSGGAAEYEWDDEGWEPAIWAGNHGQAITVRATGHAATERDLYAGIWQTISVEPGKTYLLLAHGATRVAEEVVNQNHLSYRIQWGVDYAGGRDPTRVEDWVDIPWRRVHPFGSPGPMATYSTALTARSDSLSLFVRLWKPAGRAAHDVTLNLDAISLKASEPLIDTEIVNHRGPTVTLIIPSYPVAGGQSRFRADAVDAEGVIALRLFDNGAEIGRMAYGAGLPATETEFDWTPAASGTHMLRAEATSLSGLVGIAAHTVTVGEMAEWIINGGFEDGFGADGVGSGWRPFESDGSAAGRWQDAASTVYRGEHAQRISILGDDQSATERDHVAGIYQRVAGLRAGATYRLRLHALPDTIGGDSPCALQYSLEPAGGGDWRSVSAWHALPWNGTGAYHTCDLTFTAPASELTLFIRGWMSGGTPARECHFSLDEVSLTGYR
jgi:hypothetical protein